MKEKFTSLPLTDGTKARLTAHAKKVLSIDNGVTTGRVKKGTGSDMVMVSPKRIFDGANMRPVRGKEIPLRDLLGSGAYESQLYNWHHDAAKVSHFFLKDGNCRNLIPGNFEVVFNEVTEVKERKPYVRKVTAITRPVDALSVAGQEALLSEAFPQMKAVAYAILKPDCESKTGSYAQADEVLQEASVALLQQIRTGRCHAVSRGQFFAYCFATVQRSAGWKLQALCSGVCRDVDHDDAEILLLRVKRLEAEMRVQQGMELEEDVEDMLPGVDKVWLAKELERDAKEKAKKERERIKAEGGLWHGADLEAGVELSVEDVTTDHSETQELQEAA